MVCDQREFDLGCEWGLNGLLTLLPGSDAIVIVDVLSFSTAVDIVVSNGGQVIPYRWRDESARQFADSNSALVAGGRNEGSGYSLSPASLLTIAPGTKLVIPSPNGSTLSLSCEGIPTFTACLRNAPSVAKQVTKLGTRISIIPAGERWGDDSLRPCMEDLIGAGAVLANLPGKLSPEADLSIAAFMRFRDDLKTALRRSESGRELIQKGFERDVELAAEFDSSSAAPFLSANRYVAF